MPASSKPFYRGENVNLVTPTLAHVETSAWANWFNSQRTSQHTSHAIMVNTIEDQRDFYLGLRASGRFALLVTPSDSDEPIGVVSLSGVDYRQGTAAVAIVMDTESEQRIPALASLEAMSMITRHAFEVMGLHRVEAGQAYPALKRWARLLELLGYQPEGFRREAFARGHDRSDVVMLGCLYETYLALSAARGGSLWAGSTAMLELIRNLPSESLAERLDEAQRKIIGKA